MDLDHESVTNTLMLISRRVAEDGSCAISGQIPILISDDRLPEQDILDLVLTRR
jgi:hypothetical protein